MHRHDWVVYAKPAFGGPTKVLRYLGRYTHRIAISNHRLLAFDGERVTFRWKDYAHGGKQRKMTLLATEFLRRFFLHVFPKGFVRIRYFGFLANRFRASRLAYPDNSVQQLLERAKLHPTSFAEASSLWHCPRCGATMIVVQRFTAAELSHALSSIRRRRCSLPLPDVPRHTDAFVCLPHANTLPATVRPYFGRHLRPLNDHHATVTASPVFSPCSIRRPTAVQFP